VNAPGVKRCAILPLIALKAKTIQPLFYKCRVPLQNPPTKEEKNTKEKSYLVKQTVINQKDKTT
jgi:hypothetical protein